jgi:hypothetical protein
MCLKIIFTRRVSGGNGPKRKTRENRKISSGDIKIAEISTRDCETKRDDLAERKHPEAKVNRFFSSNSN